MPLCLPLSCSPAQAATQWSAAAYQSMLDQLIAHAQGQGAELESLRSAGDALQRRLQAVGAAGDAMNSLLQRSGASLKAKEEECEVYRAHCAALEGSIAEAQRAGEERERVVRGLEAKLEGAAIAIHELTRRLEAAQADSDGYMQDAARLVRSEADRPRP